MNNMQYFKPVPHGTPGSWLHNGQAWTIADVSLMPDLMEDVSQMNAMRSKCPKLLSDMASLAYGILNSLEEDCEESEELQGRVCELSDLIAVTREALEA